MPRTLRRPQILGGSVRLPKCKVCLKSVWARPAHPKPKAQHDLESVPS